MSLRNALSVMAILLLFVGSTAAQKHRPASDKPPRVSMIALIADPQKFHEKQVTVTGFLMLRFEAVFIFLHKEDSDHVLLDNALWLDDKGSTPKLSKEMDGKYVSITGTFRARSLRRFQLSGGIVDITGAKIWPDLNHPASQEKR